MILESPNHEMPPPPYTENRRKFSPLFLFESPSITATLHINNNTFLRSNSSSAKSTAECEPIESLSKQGRSNDNPDISSTIQVEYFLLHTLL